MTRVMVTRAVLPPLEEYVQEIQGLWDTHWITNMGTKHRQLSDALSLYLGAHNIDLFTNGHSALECVLQAFDLSGEVITTPFTFASTTHAIVRTGLTPVFVDIKADDCTIDPAAVEQAITPRTTAILPVHVYGNLCDIEAIDDIARRHGLAVIYDAAHAFGVTKDGVPVGTFGDASMFSFHATKVFNTIEGGAVCFSDDGLREKLLRLKNFGIYGSEDASLVGGNAKMNEFCAAMGLCNLRHVDDEITARARVEERYRMHLADVRGLTMIDRQLGVRCNHAYFPVFFEDDFGATRDEVLDALAAQGYYGRKYFYPLVSDFTCYRDRFDSSRTSIAKDRACRVLTLPMYGSLGTSDIDTICDVIQSCPACRRSISK